MSLIELKNISVVYGVNRKWAAKVKALDLVNLTVQKGEFVTIMGKSGCGKTTLLNVIGGLLMPNEGIYTFMNEPQNVNAMSVKEMNEFRKKHIGYVVQQFALIDEMSVYENIELPLIYQNVSRKEREERVDEIMEKLAIKKFEFRMPYELSGGQKQKVAIARALITKPELIIADEPTGSLDEESGNEIMVLLKEINYEGVTIIMVTHDKELAENGNHFVYMKDGKIIGDKWKDR